MTTVLEAHDAELYAKWESELWKLPYVQDKVNQAVLAETELIANEYWRQPTWQWRDWLRLRIAINRDALGVAKKEGEDMSKTTNAVIDAMNKKKESAPVLHWNWFNKPWCQRDNWRGAGQKFKLVNSAGRVTCKACIKSARLGNK